jgi:quercetin dioxygenase-like cupin family protein
MDIVRFGVGHRRPEGPRGSKNVSGQVIHSDERGLISELAFGRHASIETHTNPHTAWFVVIEGGGFVQVGEEEARVAAGEAVHWPAEVVHGAWTGESQMRAIVVEFSAADPVMQRILEGHARPALASGPSSPASRAEGHLVQEGPDPRYDPAEGEPL